MAGATCASSSAARSALDARGAPTTASRSADDAAAPARPRRPARAALPRPQDPRRASRTTTDGRGQQTPQTPPSRSRFLRRAAARCGCSSIAVRASPAGPSGFALHRGRLRLGTLPVVAGHRRHDRLDPAPETLGGQIDQGPADDLRRGYDVLPPRHADRAVRRRPPLGAARRAPRRRRRSTQLNDHYIICGFGRVGRQVARDLRAAGARSW